MGDAVTDEENCNSQEVPSQPKENDCLSHKENRQETANENENSGDSGVVEDEQVEEVLTLCEKTGSMVDTSKVDNEQAPLEKINETVETTNEKVQKEEISINADKELSKNDDDNESKTKEDETNNVKETENESKSNENVCNVNEVENEIKDNQVEAKTNEEKLVPESIETKIDKEKVNGLDEKPKTSEEKSVIIEDDGNESEVEIIEEPQEIIEINENDTDSEEDTEARRNLKRPGGNADEEEEDMDEEFDTDLLCPEVFMDIDEAPVNTNDAAVPQDGTGSPPPYEPVFSTFVDEMTGAEITFNLTQEELSLRERLYSQHPVQFSKIHCTGCNVHLGSALDGQKNRFVHPLLKVLICKDCYHFYMSGEFEKDEDGSELYCRWCGQGGQVLCCSTCEYVFCKKCIRRNFGQRKLLDVRDSEEWKCFRCDTSQLANLRVLCSELFDYVQREISRAATLNMPSFLSTDHSQCCSAAKKAEDAAAGPPKRKRRKTDQDPDFIPTEADEVKTDKPKVVPLLPKTTVSFTPPTATITQTQPIMVSTSSAATSNVFVLAPNSMNKQMMIQNKPVFYRIGNTLVRQKAPMGANQQVRFTSTPSYIKIVPPPLRPIPPVLVASQAKAAEFPKNEWYEKTVRAAANVNSNLSYTLTQLNRAQMQANSVEALAVVHNKLQEVLSSSINSLIQIRKNLRTEFIAGIKTMRFPPKTVISTPVTSAPVQTSTLRSNDDDVIFVNQGTLKSPNSVPSTNIAHTIIAASTTPKKPNIMKKTIAKSTSKPSSLKTSTFLRVKTFSELQNISSECITLPDDESSPKTKNEPQSKQEVKGKPVLNGGLNANEFVYNVNEEPSPEVKKMKAVEVVVTRCKEIERKAKQNLLKNNSKAVAQV